jgi:hypothetical protein
VTRLEQRDELVAQLHVAHSAALVVARAQEHGQDVVAGVVDLAPAAGNLLVEELVHLLLGDEERPERGRKAPQAAQVPLALPDRGRQQPEEGTPGRIEQPRQHPPEALQPVGLGDAEDERENHLERDPLHPGPQLERLTERPALDLARRDRRDLSGVAVDVIAMERRTQELPVSQPRLVFRHQQRVLAHERREEVVAALARSSHRAVRRDSSRARAGSAT